MIQVQCVFSPAPRQVHHINLSLAEGSLVKHALVQLHQTADWQAMLAAQTQAFDTVHKQGIWGHLVATGQVLKDGDRLEIYRALLVDPKLARKQRFKRQGKGRTGLFARRRIGSVAGY